MKNADVITMENQYFLLLQTIKSASKLPGVRVDRTDFLKKVFSKSPHMDLILQNGPPSVYDIDTLTNIAKKQVILATQKTSGLSFLTGLPSNPALMLAGGTADVGQYFGFAINLAQKIAYIFGEDELFRNDTGNLSEEAQIRIIAYLGAMFSVAGASSLLINTSKVAGATIGKKVAGQALTKTSWYPLVKRVGAILGQKITKKTVEKTITKAVPVVGGIISGGLTFVTFKPLGMRLTKTFVRNLKGEFDVELVENDEFKKNQSEKSAIEEAEFVEIVDIPNETTV